MKNLSRKRGLENTQDSPEELTLQGDRRRVFTPRPVTAKRLEAAFLEVFGNEGELNQQEHDGVESEDEFPHFIKQEVRL